MRTTLAVIAVIAAGAAFAQTDPGRRDRARTGTVTNPPVTGVMTDLGGASASPDSPSGRSAPDVRHGDPAVKQQADEKRRQALEQCQTLNGASRADCVRRADEEFGRATSDDTLSDRGPDPSSG